MPYPYRLHETAYHEYILAYEWYEEHEKGVGDKFMVCVEKKLQQISAHPEYYNKKKGNFRETKIKDFPYMIVYEFLKNKKIVHISAIYHKKRNPKRKYRRFL